MSGRRNYALSVASCAVVVFVLFSSCAKAQSENADGLISPQKAYELLSGENPPLLVDVRTKEEFDAGHLKNALNVPLDAFADDDYAKKLGTPAKEEPIIVFCRSGRRSGIAREILSKDGYTNVKNVDGGMIAWTRANLPVVDEIESPVGEAKTP